MTFEFSLRIVCFDDGITTISTGKTLDGRVIDSDKKVVSDPRIAGPMAALLVYPEADRLATLNILKPKTEA